MRLPYHLLSCEKSQNLYKSMEDKSHTIKFNTSEKNVAKTFTLSHIKIDKYKEFLHQI